MRSVAVIVIAIIIFINCSDNPVNPFSSEEGFIVCTMHDDESGRRQAFKLDLDGNVIQKLTDRKKDINHLRISPDGKLIAYSFAYGGSDNVGIVSFDNSDKRIIRNSKGRVISWSPDSKLILCCVNYETNVIDLNGNFIKRWIRGYPQFYNNCFELLVVTPADFFNSSNSYNVFKYDLITEEKEFLGYFPSFRTFEYHWGKNFLVYEELKDQFNIIHYNSNEDFIIPYKPYFDAPKWTNNGKYLVHVGYPYTSLAETQDMQPSIIIYSNRGEILRILKPGKGLMCADIYINP